MIASWLFGSFPCCDCCKLRFCAFKAAQQAQHSSMLCSSVLLKWCCRPAGRVRAAQCLCGWPHHTVVQGLLTLSRRWETAFVTADTHTVIVSIGFYSGTCVFR
jgi:hypothetical protein